MFNFLQILVINLPLVFGTSETLAPSVGNFEVTATKGKATFTGVDTQIHDTFRVDGFEGIEFKGVKDSYSSRTENKNHSGSVGVFVGFNGDSAGIGLEAGVSGGKGKTNVDSETWQTNHVQANKFIANSAKGKMVVDASQIHANRWEGETQGLEVISRQDTTRYKDSQTQVSASGSVALGSGGSFSASLNHNSAKLNTSQVENQAGMFIGTGGINATVHGNTLVAGGIIDSKADSSLNTFRTQTLTTEDIENHSELKTRAFNAGTNMNPMGLMQNLLGNRDEESTTLTKAAISNNINLVLTDDPNAAQTLANLNRDTANANQKVTKHDLNQIEEQKEVAQVIGDISANTVKMYTYTEQQKVEKARLEQGKIQAELEQAGKSAEEIAKDTRYQAATEALDTAQNEYDKAYGTGSTFHRVTTAVTAAVQAAATGDNRQAIVNLASPFLNQVIKDATTDPKTKEVDKVSNALAHAVLGAAEALATGKNAFAGAAAGAGGEVAASYLTETLFPNKKPDELTESEKQQIVFLSQLAGGLAAGLVGDSSVEAASGADISRRAVENNLLKYAMEHPGQVSQLGLGAEGNKSRKEVEERISEEAITELIEHPHKVALSVLDEMSPHYVSGWIGWYKVGGKVTLNMRTLDLFVGESVSALNDFSPPKVGAGIEFGRVVNLSWEDKKNLGNSINKVLSGTSLGGVACYTIYCGSAGTTLSINSKNYQTIGIGFGSGYSLGFDNLHKLSGDKYE